MKAEKHWEEKGYGEIVAVEPGEKTVAVHFANGDRVKVARAALGIDVDTELVLEEESGGLIARGARGEREIDWMVIRRSDDPEFAEVIRERDAEESRRIGTRLRVVRENTGLSQKAAAEMIGMAAPQLAKIERGTTDMRISTVRSLLRALGVSFAEITGPDAPEVSMPELIRRGVKSEAPKETLQKIAAKVDPRRLSEALARGFAWDPEALLTGVPENPELDFEVAFKARSPEKARQSPLLRLARTLSEICAEASKMAINGLPADPAVIRKQVIDEQGELTLAALSEWAWRKGTVVIPMSGPEFSAAAWHVGERPMVVLKAKQEYSAHWLFELAHEIGHLALGHASGNDWVVDIDQPQLVVSVDAQEQEANDFALSLLVPDWELLLTEIKSGSGASTQEQKHRFKGEVERLSTEHGLAPGLLGFIAAYGLPEVAESGDRWGSATNLAKEEKPARPIVRAAFERHISLGEMSELDAALVEAVVLE
jgi:transcriptional regulator with XRE-family HTH domain